MTNRQIAPSQRDARSFVPRHIGPNPDEVQQMLDAIGVKSLDALIDATVPESIRLRKPLALPAGLSEHDALNRLRASAQKNQVFRSYLGFGYSGCLTPAVIQRNVLENPGWYTAYTPYQAEIAQGRLEALLNFQTVIIDLTGLEIANASLLDEGTAAAEAMLMCHSVKGGNGRETFFVDADCHPQTIDVVRTRAIARGFELLIGNWKDFTFTDKVFGALISYPTTDGAVYDYREFCEKAHAAGAAVTVAADLMSLVLLTPPGEFGADVCVGNSQRFGVPLGFGGPHAAFFATKDEYKRSLPGRIIGVSRDADGKAGAAHGAPDARAAHPPREGDEQRLHGAGAARRDREHVRGLSRTRRAARHRGPDSPQRDAPRRRRGEARTEGETRDLLRHAAHRSRRPAGDRPARSGAGEEDQPAAGGSVDRDHRARRDRDGERRRRLARHSRRSKADGAGGGRPREVGRRSLRRTLRADDAVPDASDVQQLPLRDGDAAVHASSPVEGSVADDVDDSARLVHDEAERDGGDVSGDLARVRPAASVRAGGSDQGLSRDVRSSREGAGRDHRIRGRVAAAERRLAGRVRRPAGDSAVSRVARRHGSGRSV